MPRKSQVDPFVTTAISEERMLRLISRLILERNKALDEAERLKRKLDKISPGS